MVARTLEHISLLTGSARRSPRSEVADNVVAAISSAIQRDGRLWDGWSVRMVARAPAGGLAFDLVHGDRDISHCWLCRDRSAADAMWDSLADVETLPGTVLHRPSSVPWLAVTLSPRVISAPDPSVLGVCGDVERCVAWALLEGARPA